MWSVLRASPDAVWEAWTDPAELVAALPWWMRWEVSDPEGLRRALREGSARTWSTRWRWPGGTLDCPIRVTDAAVNLRCAVEGRSAAFGTCEHRLRLERALGGRVRLVQEILVESQGTSGPGGRLAVELMRGAFVMMHRRMARHFPDPEAVGRSRIYRLVQANHDHRLDPLGHGHDRADGRPP